MSRRSSTSSTPKKRADLSDATRICVLHGPEPMVQRLHLESLQDELEKKHGEIDTILFDGQTTSLANVMDELRTLALLQTYKLVIVDPADPFVTTHRSALERYAQDPSQEATLVLRGTKWHRGKLDAMIEKVGCIIKCDQPSPPSAKSWLIQRASRQHQRTLESASASLLVDRVGCDLLKLDNELAKLALLTGENEPIRPSHVEQIVGRGSDDQAWMVQESIMAALASPAASHAGSLAIHKIHELIDQSGQPDVLVSYFVADLIRKLNLAQVMHRQGASATQIAQRFKLWGPRRDLFIRLLNRLDTQQSGRLLDRIIDMDRRSKSGLGQAMRNLECFCAALAEEVT